MAAIFAVCALAAGGALALPSAEAATTTAAPSVQTAQVNGMTVTTTTFADGSTVESVDGTVGIEDADNTDTTDVATETDGGFEFGQPSTADLNPVASTDCNVQSEYDQLVAMGVDPTEAAASANPLDVGAGCSSTTDTTPVEVTGTTCTAPECANTSPAIATSTAAGGSDAATRTQAGRYSPNATGGTTTTQAKTYLIHDHCHPWNRTDKHIRGFGCDVEYRVGPVYHRTVQVCPTSSTCTPESQVMYNTEYKFWESARPTAGADKGISGLLMGINTPNHNFLRDFDPSTTEPIGQCGTKTTSIQFGLDTGGGPYNGGSATLGGSITETQPVCPQDLEAVAIGGPGEIGKFSSKWNGNHHGYSSIRKTEGVAHYVCGWQASSGCQATTWVHWWME